MFVLMRWVLPRVVAVIARSQELLLVFAIAWGVALAALANGRASARKRAPSWPASRWPPRLTAKP